MMERVTQEVARRAADALYNISEYHEVVGANRCKTTLLDFIAQHPDEPEIHNVSHIYEDEPEQTAPDVAKALGALEALEIAESKDSWRQLCFSTIRAALTPEPPAPDVDKALREVMDCARNSRRRREHLLALDDGRRLLDDYGDRLESIIRAALAAKQAEPPAPDVENALRELKHLRDLAVCAPGIAEIRQGEADDMADTIRAALMAKQPEGVEVEVVKTNCDWWIKHESQGVSGIARQALLAIGVHQPGRYRFCVSPVDEPTPRTRAQTLAEAENFCRLHGACDLADAVREIAKEFE